MTGQLLVDERFPRASAYHPDWVLAGVSGGANSLWLAEWLAEAMDLQAGTRVLDLGCGRGASSVFLAREFGVRVWAADLWFPATERLRRVEDAGVADRVFPIHADARALPFADGFFDAVVSIDSFVYYGTDDLYLNHLARFVRPGGAIGIAGAGLTQELDGPPPEHLRAWWEPSMACLHSAPWWRRHWSRSGLVDVELADSMPEGWRRWLSWQRAAAPDNQVEIDALEADRGRYLGYVRAVARRTEATPDEPVTSIPARYTPAPLLGVSGPASSMLTGKVGHSVEAWSGSRGPRQDAGMSSRSAAVERASRPFMEFFHGPVLARRTVSANPCDFVTGNPHDEPVPGLVEALRVASVPQRTDWFAYKFSEEVPRRAATAALRERTGMAFDPEDVLLTKGAASALPVVLQTVVDPGDEVVYVLPPWFFYAPMIVAAGGVGVPVRCDPDTFDLDVEAIAAACSPRTRAVIVNSPNNPTGRVYPPATLERLADALTTASARNGRPVYLISDEAYQRIVFPGTAFVSPTAFYPHSFLVYSYAKTLLNPGQRLGYVALPPDMPGRETMRAELFLQQMAGGQGWPDAVMQYALPTLEGLCIDIERIRRRKDTLLAALRSAGYSVHDPEGTFYLLPRSPIPDDAKFAELLADRDVFVLPGYTVELPGYFRISLTASDAMVERSLDAFADAHAVAGRPA